MGDKASHHLILRFCNINLIQPEELRPEHLPLLGKFLRQNLEFFTGKDRANDIAERFGTLLLKIHSPIESNKAAGL